MCPFFFGGGGRGGALTSLNVALLIVGFLVGFKVWIEEQFIVGTNAYSFHCTDSWQ